jgi:hypothetical protein
MALKGRKLRGAAAPAAPAEPPPVHPPLEALRAEMSQLLEFGSHEPGPWIEFWPRVEALVAGEPAGTPIGVQIAEFREEVLGAARGSLGIASLAAALPAARALVAAAATVFNGQPQTVAWPSKIGRVISPEIVIAEYDTLKEAMAAYGAKVAELDAAIKAAREAELLWLLPEGSFRCPVGAKELLRHFAFGANLLSSPRDEQELGHFLRHLALFSTPGRSQETLASLLNPFRQEMMEYAKEARAQLDILVKAGPTGDAGSLLLDRPFRFRGVELSSDSSTAYVLGSMFFIGSSVLVWVVSRELPPLATAGLAVLLFGVSALCAVLPARNARADHWQEAVDSATAVYASLREALVVRRPPLPKSTAAGKTDEPRAGAKTDPSVDKAADRPADPKPGPVGDKTPARPLKKPAASAPG